MEQTILDAIDALMASGYSRIGFIGGLGNIMGEHEYPEDVRTFAFRNWALRLGLDVKGLVYADGPFTVENGRLQGRQLVQDHADDLPDAVIVAADPLAVGVLQAFATENVMVPRDIKVISINNQEIAKYTSPALSSYDISQDELAKAAVLMLAEALTANRKISQHMRISTSLVARDSFTPQN
ncbi:MAG: substrate-binding domain-containing protein [Escherichia coli]|nr:substrate-binding domain-containing protein [Escherichia coli]